MSILLYDVINAVGALSPEDMPPQHRLIMIMLADHGEGRAHPSLAMLAQRTGYSRSTVAAAVADLERAGWLSREHRFEGGKMTSNAYQIRTDGTPIRRLDQSKSRTSPSDGLVRHQDPSTTRTVVVRELDGGGPGAGHKPPSEPPIQPPKHTQDPPAGARETGPGPAWEPTFGHPGELPSPCTASGDAPTEAVVHALRKHPVVVSAAERHPQGVDNALLALAQAVVGRCCVSAGRPVDVAIEAIDSAAAQLTAEAGGARLTWAAVSSKINTYTWKQRPPTSRKPTHEDANSDVVRGIRDYFGELWAKAANQPYSAPDIDLQHAAALWAEARKKAAEAVRTGAGERNPKRWVQHWIDRGFKDEGLARRKWPLALFVSSIGTFGVPGSADQPVERRPRGPFSSGRGPRVQRDTTGDYSAEAARNHVSDAAPIERGFGV